MIGFLMLVGMLAMAWFGEPALRARRLLAVAGLIILSVGIGYLADTDTSVGRALKAYLEAGR